MRRLLEYDKHRNRGRKVQRRKQIIKKKQTQTGASSLWTFSGKLIFLSKDNNSLVCLCALSIFLKHNVKSSSSVTLDPCAEGRVGKELFEW